MNYPVIALDIETTGLNPWKDEITVIGMYDSSGYWQQDIEQFGITHEVVCHNAQFDIKFLKVKGLLRTDTVVHDTKIMAHLVRDKVPKAFIDWYEEERKLRNKSLPKGQTYREASPLSLKVLAPWYLKVDPFWETPGDYSNEEYNRKDCLYTYQLYQLFRKKLEDEGSWDFYLRMLSWSKMIMDMEIKGIRISPDELNTVEKEYLKKHQDLGVKLDDQWASHHHEYRQFQYMELKQKYTEMAQKAELKAKDPLKTAARYNKLYLEACEKIESKINYSSPAQMAWLLKEQLGLNITDMEGEESTGKAVLNKLASEGRKDIQTFLDWREADKVLTMYVPTYKELQDAQHNIHPSFNLTGTRTGRTSSSGPNLQQVPPKLYRLFRPRPGHKLIQYDLSGIEAALIALYSDDKTLYDILEKGESIHDHNAKAMFGLECDVSQVSSLHPRERKVVKNIGFACFYGAGWRRISQVFATGGFPISDSDAKAKLKLLKSYYPQAFEFHKEITQVFESGETVYNLLGRPITLQPHENPYMQGFNTLIQSSASDLNLRACEKATEKWGGQAWPLLVIHDCIVAEAPDRYSKEAEKILIDAMCNFKLESSNGPIQLRVEGGIYDVWTK